MCLRLNSTAPAFCSLVKAQEYKREEGIEWPVLVDDYAGTVHRTYSREMADPVFLIDSDGRVAFYVGIEASRVRAVERGEVGRVSLSTIT